MQKKSLTGKSKSFFVVHFTNSWSNELFTHYFYMDNNATTARVNDMISRYDQGDADPATASHPVEIQNWEDVDPKCYGLVFFAEDKDLDLEGVTLIEFMHEYWIHSDTYRE